MAVYCQNHNTSVNKMGEETQNVLVLKLAVRVVTTTFERVELYRYLHFTYFLVNYSIVYRLNFLICGSDKRR